jgi:rod shape-determining protein MreC
LEERSRPVYSITAPIRGLAQRFAYLGLVIAAFALLMLGKADTVLVERLRVHVTDAVAPILDMASRPVATISEMAADVRELAAIRAENARLRQERGRLLQWQAVARQLEAENKALHGLLNFHSAPAARFISARVIAEEGGAFARSLLINAGIHAGVRKGQAVMTGEGLVGRITDVGERAARVLPIMDLNSRIPVLVESTRTHAILTGDNSHRPLLTRLPPEAGISSGDRIVTSGHAGAFPPGLQVGVVASISDRGIGVQPYVDFFRLEYVRVVDFGLDGILRLPGAPLGRGGKRRQ